MHCTTPRKVHGGNFENIVAFDVFSFEREMRYYLIKCYRKYFSCMALTWPRNFAFHGHSIGLHFKTDTHARPCVCKLVAMVLFFTRPGIAILTAIPETCIDGTIPE